MNKSMIALYFFVMCCGVQATDMVQGVTLHARIQKWMTPSCVVTERCQTLLRIDCQSSRDGPEYFVNNQTGEMLMRCGGRCLLEKREDVLDCTACPPPQWLSCRAENP